MTKSPVENIFKKLSQYPLIVSAIAGAGHLTRLTKQSEREGADLIEIRFDSFSPHERKNLPALLKSVRLSTSLPLIATVRSSKEQGNQPRFFKINDRERIEIYKIVLPFADFIDLELSSAPGLFPIVRLAHQRQKKVILSYHNFSSIPSKAKIDQLVIQFKKHSGDIFKVAATPKSAPEISKLMLNCLALNGLNRVFIAMGNLSWISRVFGFYFGSCLTYGCIGKPTAPGQISVNELVKYRKILHSSSI